MEISKGRDPALPGLRPKPATDRDPGEPLPLPLQWLARGAPARGLVDEVAGGQCDKANHPAVQEEHGESGGLHAAADAPIVLGDAALSPANA